MPLLAWHLTIIYLCGAGSSHFGPLTFGLHLVLFSYRKFSNFFFLNPYMEACPHLSDNETVFTCLGQLDMIALVVCTI